jgi:hypothetical protein
MINWKYNSYDGGKQAYKDSEMITLGKQSLGKPGRCMERVQNHLQLSVLI